MNEYLKPDLRMSGEFNAQESRYVLEFLMKWYWLQPELIKSMMENVAIRQGLAASVLTGSFSHAVPRGSHLPAPYRNR